MDIELLDFVRECKRLAKRALGKRAARLENLGFLRYLMLFRDKS